VLEHEALMGALSLPKDKLRANELIERLTQLLLR
jgi:hypothetical protein